MDKILNNTSHLETEYNFETVLNMAIICSKKAFSGEDNPSQLLIESIEWFSITESSHF